MGRWSHMGLAPCHSRGSAWHCTPRQVAMVHLLSAYFLFCCLLFWLVFFLSLCLFLFSISFFGRSVSLLASSGTSTFQTLHSGKLRTFLLGDLIFGLLFNLILRLCLHFDGVPSHTLRTAVSVSWIHVFLSLSHRKNSAPSEVFWLGFSTYHGANCINGEQWLP